jgi:hypothetical protein
MTAKELLEQSKIVNEGYFFTYSQMQKYNAQICQEQRESCKENFNANQGKSPIHLDSILNAKQPTT